MNEYALRYAGFAEWMNAHEVNVWCLDAFGQGRNAESEQLLERWPENGFDRNVDGIYEMIRLASRNGLPTYHMGHSMGSFMTQSLMERYPLSADGIILCGSNGGQPHLMKTGFNLSKILVRDSNWYKENRTLQNMGMGGFAKAVKNRQTDFDWLSYNKENVQSYIDDPWCGHWNTGGFWKEFMRGMSKIWQNREMEKMSRREKILIISGEDDPVGRMGKGPVWLWKKYRNMGLNRTVLKLYPRMRHEILNEDGKETVYRDILRFIRPGYY
jgi:alpha-beta hydrolase superfamily lysophospholipase